MKELSVAAIIEDQAAIIARGSATHILLLRFASHMNRGFGTEAVIVLKVYGIIENETAFFHMDLTMDGKIVGFAGDVLRCIQDFAFNVANTEVERQFQA